MISRSSLAASGLTLLTLASPALAGPQRMEYQRDPQALGRDASRVQEWVMDVPFQTLAGKSSSLAQAFGEKGLVVAMRDPECPLSKKYSPRIKTLALEAERMGFGFLFVGMDNVESGEKDRETYGLTGTYAVDPQGLIARELDARTSTEVFVIDAGQTLAYRGMIDDQYGLGFSKVTAERYFLVDAMEAVAAGRSVAVPATTAQGCLLDIETAEPAPRELTYHNRISRIIQNRCQSCHRPGEAGPFQLMDYRQVKKRRSMIAWALEEKTMPPWFADEESGPWANDNSLTEGELEDVLAWIDNGAPEGDAQQGPLPLQWVEGWTIDSPDLVVSMEEAFTVPAEGVVDYQYFYAKTNLEEDKWVEAVEVRSSGGEVVHHALVFIEEPGLGRQTANGGPHFQTGATFFASAVPGQTGMRFPTGTGKLLPAGSWIKFQMHYTVNGTEMEDITSVGFVFADEPLIEVRTSSAFSESFMIPARSFGHEVTADYRFPEDGTLMTLFPHTHLRGMAFNCELVLPDGEVQPLLDLAFYDFNWQLNYQLATPIQVLAGTRLRATAWYDNTEQNPANPDPDKNVRFGEQTWEEMMIAYVNWIPTKPTVIEASSPVLEKNSER